MAPSTPEPKITHAMAQSTSRRRLRASGRKNRSGRCVEAPPEPRPGEASGLIRMRPRLDTPVWRAVRRGESSGRAVISRNAGGTTEGPVRRSTRSCWWNSPIESPDRRSDRRRRRLGPSTAAHTTPSIRRTTIVKNPSIYLPMSYDPTEYGITMGGWSGTVRALHFTLTRTNRLVMRPARPTGPRTAPR